MAEPALDPGPSLEQMRFDDLAHVYGETLRAQYPKATETDIQLAAETAARLFQPLVDEVDSGRIPFIRVLAEIQGFDIDVTHGGE